MLHLYQNKIDVCNFCSDCIRLFCYLFTGGMLLSFFNAIDWSLNIPVTPEPWGRNRCNSPHLPPLSEYRRVILSSKIKIDYCKIKIDLLTLILCHGQ